MPFVSLLPVTKNCRHIDFPLGLARLQVSDAPFLGRGVFSGMVADLPTSFGILLPQGIGNSEYEVTSTRRRNLKGKPKTLKLEGLLHGGQCCGGFGCAVNTVAV